MFALNSRHFWGPQIKRGDLVRWPHLAAPTAPIDESDIDAVAVRTLIENGHAEMEYVITGPQSLSQREQISTIGSVIDRSLRIEELSPDEVSREGLAGMPMPVVAKLMDAWAAAVGQPAFVTSTIEENDRQARAEVGGMGRGKHRAFPGVGMSISLLAAPRKPTP